uniref:RE39877p n=1 Tax=Drosophila melanogaster TaxID=7227 RepID=Q8SYR2_DROME
MPPAGLAPRPSLHILSGADFFLLPLLPSFLSSGSYLRLTFYHVMARYLSARVRVLRVGVCSVSMCVCVCVCASSSLFAFLSKSSEITFFYAMLLMLFAYVSCRLQYLQMNAVRCRSLGPWSSVLGGLVLWRIRQAAVEPTTLTAQLPSRPTAQPN